MKVLHATKVRGIGGAEQHLLALLPALRERGIDARFLSLDAGGDADRFHRALDARGIPFTRIACGADVSPQLARDFVRAMRAERPDLVHTHMVHADVYGSVAAHLTRTPFLSTRHNDDRYLLGPFRYVDRAFMRGVRRIIAISDAVREFHVRAGLPPEKLVTIHYGLDEAPQAPSEVTPATARVPDGAPLVVSVARLIEQKDHATLLRAFARVHAQRPDAHLALLGWGRLEHVIRAEVDELELGDSVHLLGRVEPRDWLARADLFAHTPRWEGFGIVLLEAMLSGLPVVATRVSAIPEIVVDGATGDLVTAGDERAVAERVLALLADAGKRRAYGEAGLRRAREQFSVARMADRTVDVYEAALR
jgi:glycosyltransferase involved in cell wall biosynthesis